ncbi:hypothetical protein FOA52_000407 [Chlamydomonas sp. UWO 241]|nr:hypothetical protein FOA52_000407 [Chlamydomonas sp. UWO 241]
MKFSHQLKFNTVPEWRDNYIPYGHLKRIIYAIAKAETEAHAHGTDDEALHHYPPGTPDKVEAKEEDLITCLDENLAKVIRFFLAKEAETLGKQEQLDLQIHSREQQRLPGMPGLSASPSMQLEAVAVGDELRAPLVSHRLAEDAARKARVDYWLASTRGMRGRGPQTERAAIRQQIVDLFVALHDLENFLNYNKEGFRKVLKKHDKLTSSNLKDRYWGVIEQRYPSNKAKGLADAIERLVEQFAVLFTGGDTAKAKASLNRVLRDQIKVERNTVWRDMVAMERRTLATTVLNPEMEAKELPFLRAHWSPIMTTLAAAVFATLLSVDTFPEPEKKNCLALLTFVSVLWATEAIPLFATSMLVPPLAVILRVLVDHNNDDVHGHRMTAEHAAPAIFHAMFSQTIMLLLGGFAIAGALSKHFIAKQLAVKVLSNVGRKPRNVLLAAMFVATFASMWISNVAAPVLTYSIMMPILKTLDPSNSFAKSLVMGIALASNIGGMTSPISSPQNIFAIERMSMDGQPPSWLSWFAVSLPVSIICVFVCWIIILVVYQPWREVTDVRPLKPSTDPMNKTQVYVIVVSLLTVGLWCANSALQDVTGEMGVLAALPLVAFFGTGVLSKDDFNGFLWNVVMLAMGGLALGEAVKSSGLLQSIAQTITEQTVGMDLYQVLLIFCLLVLICTTFISHTVGAMVILPIVQRVGEDMLGGHPKLLVMAAALMCSGAMGLPVSGFPNMQAVSLEDSFGQPYVATIDFLKVGVPASIAAYFTVVTVGYFMMLVVRF